MRTPGGATTSFLFDGLGSERTVTNSSGAVQGALTLSAFGQTITSSGSSTSAYQWGAMSGYRSEGDVGLTLVGCRFYDAQVGRFITRDTYLDQKPYTYCDGDPANEVDPSGHDGNLAGLVPPFEPFHITDDYYEGHVPATGPSPPDPPWTYPTPPTTGSPSPGPAPYPPVDGSPGKPIKTFPTPIGPVTIFLDRGQIYIGGGNTW